MKRDDPINNDDKIAIECLIKRYGKRALRRAMDKSETRGKAGRPRGTPKYMEADLEMLNRAELSRAAHREEKLRERQAGEVTAAKVRGDQTPLSRKEPKWRSLLAKVAEKADKAGLGMSEDAVVARLAKRGSVARVILDAIRESRPDLMQYLPEDADARFEALENDPDNIVHFGTFFHALLSAVKVTRPDMLAEIESDLATTETPSARSGETSH